MRARLIAVGERMPAWVAEGFAEYRKRLSHELPLELVEIKLGSRGKGRDPARAIADEGAAVRTALPKDVHIVALDGHGTAWSSEQLASELKRWRMQGRDLAFLIGGPDGHASDILASFAPALVARPADAAAHARAARGRRAALSSGDDAGRASVSSGLKAGNRERGTENEPRDIQ